MLRGGSPSAYDRILATQFGVHAAKLISQEKYGRTVAKIGGKITANKLEDIAGKTKFVDPSDQLVKTAKNFNSEITIAKDGKSVNALKLMALMGLGVKCGDTITVTVSGEDEESAASAMEEFFKSNL